ncbi:MAG: EF-P lysine aminoacylase EpmA [Patescibacteria group bacterium]|jgi:lysyl-tRNA synthetase class 2
MSTWQDLKNNARLRKIYEERLLITKCVREFFWSRGFVEAETSISMRLPGQEPYLNPIAIKLNNAASESQDFHLRTSPEYALKKLLASGFQKVFEIGKCFRNKEDFGGSHQPEFTMLEWYRAPGTLADIMDDTEKLFKEVMKKINKKEFTYRDKRIPVFVNWERASMKELFQKYLSVNLDDYLEPKNIFELAKKLNYNVVEGEEYENIFFKIFLNEIEPKLGIEKPIFVYDYPAQMCSLSKLSADSRYAERFELYVGGLEVANAFGELTDPSEQKKRLETDRDLRQKLGKETWPVDEDFTRALGELKSRGAEAGGVALGLDRMVILCTDARDITETTFNSVKDQLDI